MKPAKNHPWRKFKFTRSDKTESDYIHYLFDSLARQQKRKQHKGYMGYIGAA